MPPVDPNKGKDLTIHEQFFAAQEHGRRQALNNMLKDLGETQETEETIKEMEETMKAAKTTDCLTSVEEELKSVSRSYNNSCKSNFNAN